MVDLEILSMEEVRGGRCKGGTDVVLHSIFTQVVVLVEGLLQKPIDLIMSELLLEDPLEALPLRLGPGDRLELIEPLEDG